MKHAYCLVATILVFCGNKNFVIEGNLAFALSRQQLPRWCCLQAPPTASLALPAGAAYE